MSSLGPARIECRSLSVSYGVKNQLMATGLGLKDVSFKLAPGEILGVVGASGSGKSSLLGALAKIVPHCSGQMRLNGREYGDFSFDKMRSLRSELQLVPQDAAGSFDPRRAVGKSLYDALLWLRPEVDKRESRRIIEGLWQDLGLPPEKLEHLPSAFSGGQIKRAVLARSLVVKPNVLLLDEPFAGLARSDQQRLGHLLSDVFSGSAISGIVVSHELSTLINLADRLIVLHEGSMIEEGPINQVLDHPKCEVTAAWIRAANNNNF